MKTIEWDDKKNGLLQKERNVCFEDVVVCLINNQILDIVTHPNKEKYPNQQIFIINLNDYAYLIPFVEDKNTIFLKTIIPSRKMTKKYLTKEAKK